MSTFLKIVTIENWFFWTGIFLNSKIDGAIKTDQTCKNVVLTTLNAIYLILLLYNYLIQGVLYFGLYNVN